MVIWRLGNILKNVCRHRNAKKVVNRLEKHVFSLVNGEILSNFRAPSYDVNRHRRKEGGTLWQPEGVGEEGGGTPNISLLKIPNGLPIKQLHLTSWLKEMQRNLLKMIYLVKYITNNRDIWLNKPKKLNLLFSLSLQNAHTKVGKYYKTSKSAIRRRNRESSATPGGGPEPVTWHPINRWLSRR